MTAFVGDLEAAHDAEKFARTDREMNVWHDGDGVARPAESLGQSVHQQCAVRFARAVAGGVRWTGSLPRDMEGNVCDLPFTTWRERLL
jgi:hypothetical protein